MQYAINIQQTALMHATSLINFMKKDEINDEKWDFLHPLTLT